MERLPIELRINGYNYTQLKRGKKACIYEQHVTPGTLRFEVIFIKLRPAEEVMGRDYPEREVYPCNEDWGKKGWTYIELENALRAFDRIESGKYK